MGDWQWFEDFEMEALERADHERLRLLQIHRDAFLVRETDPDRMLLLFQEGRRLSLALGEPWWVLLYDHWLVHGTLHHKQDYRNVLEPAVRNVLELRKPQYLGFPQRLWMLNDLVAIYLNLDPRGYATEIDQTLAQAEAELTTEMDNSRYLLRFSRLDAAANQNRIDDALQIAMSILAQGQADPNRQTADHFLIFDYETLCHLLNLRQQWAEVATWAETGEMLARQLIYQQPLSLFLMWQAVVARRAGEKEKAARFYRSATSRMGRLRKPLTNDYYDALCSYHELGGNLEKSLQLRSREIQEFTARGLVYTTFDARLAQLRLLKQMGQDVAQYLSEAREAARKFRQPESYLAEIEKIVGQVHSPEAET